MRFYELLVFPEGGSIHGISFREETEINVGWDAVVYGGDQLAFCSISQWSELNIKEVSNEPSSTISVGDWIWDAKVLQANGSPSTLTVALGLGRHVIDLWEAGSCREGIVQVSKIRRIQGKPSCLAMSMNVFQDNSDRFWVATGTAFHCIQVWSTRLEGSQHGESDTYDKLEGHAGVVHSVQFSANGQDLVSTSDDRSVRYWRRQCDERWNCLWVGWGHTARVWRAVFVDENVVSVSEDATARIWSAESGASLGVLSHSTGLWSIAACQGNALVGSTNGTVA